MISICLFMLYYHWPYFSIFCFSSQESIHNIQDHFFLILSCCTISIANRLKTYVTYFIFSKNFNHCQFFSMIYPCRWSNHWRWVFFIKIPSLDRLPTKAKVLLFAHSLRICNFMLAQPPTAS